jgi:putative addiction module component (TIGR02574 family)
MPIPVEQLTEEALSLGADARALLADRLVESLDPLADAETRALWAAEALRRRDEVRSGQVDPISEDEVAEHVRRFLKR